MSAIRAIVGCVIVAFTITAIIGGMSLVGLALGTAPQ